jgi:hypothetical protein
MNKQTRHRDFTIADIVMYKAAINKEAALEMSEWDDFAC